MSVGSVYYSLLVLGNGTEASLKGDSVGLQVLFYEVEMHNLHLCCLGPEVNCEIVYVSKAGTSISIIKYKYWRRLFYVCL